MKIQNQNETKPKTKVSSIRIFLTYIRMFRVFIEKQKKWLMRISEMCGKTTAMTVKMSKKWLKTSESVHPSFNLMWFIDGALSFR